MGLDVAPRVTTEDYRSVVEATKGYDSLTIGDAAKHLEDLHKATSFGGRCLQVVLCAQPPEAYEPIDWSDDPNHPQLPLELEEVA